MLITIDPYYSIQTYNTSKEALKNNNISFNEFMCLKAPYHWYLELPTKPMMMNFDELSKGVERYVVSIVKPLTPLDQWTYFRRNNDKTRSTAPCRQKILRRRRTYYRNAETRIRTIH